MGWLDRVPPMWRDLLLMVAASALTWAGAELVPWLEGRDGWAPVLAPLVGVLVTAGTRWTTAYGRGAAGRHEAIRP